MESADLIFKVIGNSISETTGTEFCITNIQSVSGGDINNSYRIEDATTRRCFFVKLNQSKALFTSEQNSLAAIAAIKAITCPQVIASGVYNATAFLVLEYMDIRHHGDEYQLGQQLAALHRHTQPQFGFVADNFIGTTPQRNDEHQNWLDFWRDCRLQPQLEFAYRNGYHEPLHSAANQLMGALPVLLGQHQPTPSLVHGDLWSGNKGFLKSGEPIIFDPACYFGDREVDIAMTELFGGFSPDFYRGYNAAWPLDSGYEKRKPLYNLYHQLNHLNLFGSGYLSSCLNTMRALV